MARVKKTFRLIPKQYKDPEGFDDVLSYCGKNLNNLYPLIMLLITDGNERNASKNNWVDLYLSEYENQPSYFHQDFYKSQLENYIFYTIQAANHDLYEECERLKEIRNEFIELMMTIYSRLKAPNLKKIRDAIEESDDKIYNEYLSLFEDGSIETMGKVNIQYFDED